MKKPNSLDIRVIESLDELQQVYVLESSIWSADDTVPVSHSVASVKNGGLVLGAFDGSRLVGFQYSFPGFDGKDVYLYSHNLGIHPDYRRLGIGEQLKLAQRKAALERGYRRIVWTYDPLETVNGNLNLHKLGAKAVGYIENAYGEMTDGMNAGLPSDRFIVHWDIETEEKRSPADWAEFHSLIGTSVKDGLLIAENLNWQTNKEKLMVPVPADFQRLKQADFSSALLWREKTAELFKDLLTCGWVVTDLVRHPDITECYAYLIERRGNEQ